MHIQDSPHYTNTEMFPFTMQCHSSICFLKFKQILDCLGNTPQKSFSNLTPDLSVAGKTDLQYSLIY